MLVPIEQLQYNQAKIMVNDKNGHHYNVESDSKGNDEEEKNADLGNLKLEIKEARIKVKNTLDKQLNSKRYVYTRVKFGRPLIVVYREEIMWVKKTGSIEEKCDRMLQQHMTCGTPETLS